MARSAGQGAYLRLQTVTVFVRDLDRSLRFYVDQLGFNLVFDVRIEKGHRMVVVAPPDGTAVIRLQAPEPGSAQEQLIGRMTYVSFLTDDVLAKFRDWTRRGVHFRQMPRLKRIRYDQRTEPVPNAQAPVWGGAVGYFEDPDHNTFALVGFDDASRAIEAQRRAEAERQEAERRAVREMEIARQVQARLFPQMRPQLGTLEYAGVCTQAREVGGDYYDFLDLGSGRLGLVLGDIAGKGIAAALLMANLQANLRSQCAVAREEPHRFLRSVNRLFYENTAENAYATLFFAEYDDGSRRLRYANCGHPAALVFRASGDVERLESTCTVLGLFDGWDSDVCESELAPGDALLIYTDGVTECLNPAGEEFGEQRLVEAFRGRREMHPSTLLAAILDDVKRFSPCEQQDDITLIAARCK